MTRVRAPTARYVGNKILSRFARFLEVTPRPFKTSTRPTPTMVRVLEDTPIVRLRAQQWLEYVSKWGYDAEMEHRTMRLEGFECRVVVLTATKPRADGGR